MGRDHGQGLLLGRGGRDEAVEGALEGGGVSGVKLMGNRRLSFHGGPPSVAKENKQRRCFNNYSPERWRGAKRYLLS
jgi:hypothetical protein